MRHTGFAVRARKLAVRRANASWEVVLCRKPHYAFAQLVHNLRKPEQDGAHMHLTGLCNLHKCTSQNCVTYINRIPCYASCRRCLSSAWAHPPPFRFTHLVHNLHNSLSVACVQLTWTRISVNSTGLHKLCTTYANSRCTELSLYHFCISCAQLA